MKFVTRLDANTRARASGVANTLARASMLANTLARASGVANTLARASGAALAALALSGCATVIRGETQTVNVTSPPAWGARCVLYNADGYHGDLITPGAITVPRSRDDLSVTCTKRGFKDASQTVSSDFNFITFGNLAIGGLMGVTIDATSGANDSYPEDIEMPMELVPRPPATTYTSPYPAS